MALKMGLVLTNPFLASALAAQALTSAALHLAQVNILHDIVRVREGGMPFKKQQCFLLQAAIQPVSLLTDSGLLTIPTELSGADTIEKLRQAVRSLAMIQRTSDCKAVPGRCQAANEGLHV